MANGRPLAGFGAMLFGNWEAVGRAVATCVVGYAIIVVLVRISGKRSLSKLNAFDFVINVALGSLLATMVLSDSVGLAEGVAALATLTLLQYVVSWLTVRSSIARAIVKAEPALLFYRGEFQARRLLCERISEDEVRSAVRQQGVLGLEQVEAVILETSGTLSVVVRDQVAGTALDDVDLTAARTGRRADPSGVTQH